MLDIHNKQWVKRHHQKCQHRLSSSDLSRIIKKREKKEGRGLIKRMGLNRKPIRWLWVFIHHFTMKYRGYPPAVMEQPDTQSTSTVWLTSMTIKELDLLTCLKNILKQKWKDNSKEFSIQIPLIKAFWMESLAPTNCHNWWTKLNIDQCI